MWRSPATDPARIDRLLVIFAWKRTQACAPSTCHNRSPARNAAFQSNNPKAKLRGAFVRTRCSALLAASRRHLLLPHPTVRQHPLMLLVKRRRMPGRIAPAGRSAAGRWGHALGRPIHIRRCQCCQFKLGTRRKGCVGRWCDDGLGPGGLSRLNVGPVVLLILLRVDLLPLRVGH